jgi:hypothetical protein
MRALALFVSCLCLAAQANAALLVTAPEQVCNFLKESGFVTRGWKRYIEQEFGCTSDPKQIGTGSPLANNLTYYAEGNSSSAAKQVKLVLNVNNRASAALAHEELSKAAAALSPKATGATLPQPVVDAIKSGARASQRVGTATVEVAKSEWPTGKGYDVKVIFN